ncbi:MULTISPECIES: hypothetical protein [Methylobacterium]|uniref:hypothetical protein n=1 Tax=Methylobacterium TaxID=407 RepID=UPI00104FC467|nr:MULTISPECIES: hypothetical protein [Methylobacterium]MDR7037306.1 hypothetical protein [Methylobacterium sp. BE186]
MPTTQTRLARRSRKHGFALTLAAAGIVLGTAAVHAQEEGLGGLFRQLFSPAQPTPQTAPPAEVQMPSAARYYGRRHAQGGRVRPKVRYAALPKPEPLKVRITDRQQPLDMKAGAAAALLRDETLRPGDIVILKDGARVFTGNPDKKHAMHEFEPVDRSRQVDKKTRRLLAGMMAPVGALPADEARRQMARLKRAATPRHSEPLQAEAVQTEAAVRVINPWSTSP